MPIARKKFGFLKDPIQVNFAGVEINPLPDHDERKSWFEKNSNRDGFFYPPEIATYETDLWTREITRKVERSERPAIVYHLPASHDILVTNPTGTFDSAHSDTVLIIYLLAFIYGTRLQLSDWRIEGRAPEKPMISISATEKSRLHFLEYVYIWWRSIGDAEKTKFINILYVITRAKSLEWDWDQFLHQYMVFDALYQLHTSLNKSKQKAPTHRERFNIILNAYSMPIDNELINKIYKARNELFHEAMWTGSTISFGSQDADANQLPRHLSRINERLICGITGYTNEFSKSAWWAMGLFLFNSPQ